MNPNFADKYRPAAGIALFNKRGQVFLGKRNSTNSPYIWQMPQGGIDAGESPLQAAIRELEEETGIAQKHIKLIGHIEDWLYYDFPPDYKGSKKARGWHGQKQKWFAFAFLGPDKYVDLAAHKPVEFTDWKWDSLARAAKLVVPFKHHIYKRIHTEFSKFETKAQ